MFMLRKAWDAIPNSTFTNCFRKAGISQTSIESALREDDNPFAGLEAVEEDVLEMLQGDLHRLKATFGGADIPLDEYVDIDSDVSTNAAVLNDQDILAEVVGCVAESDDDEVESSDEPVAKPPISEVHKAIEILEKFLRSGEDLMLSLKVVNRVIHAEEQLSKSNQPSMLTLEKKSEVCRTYLSFCTPTPNPLLWPVIPVSVAKMFQK